MKVKIVKSSNIDTQIRFITKEDAGAIRDFKGESGNIAVIYDKKQTLIYCGLGEKKKVTTDTIRGAAAGGIKRAVDLKRKRVALIDPKPGRAVDHSSVSCLEGALLGAYSFGKYKTEKPHGISLCEFVTAGISRHEADTVSAVCDCTFYARDLVNDNAHVTYPEQLAREARKIASSNSVSCTVLTEREISRKGLGLLEAVGQGSPYPPRLIIMRYSGNKNSKKQSAIIGKGITFDSGGQNLKPSGHIETMRCDMSGAAAVLGTMKALTILKPKINVLGVVAAAHNAIGAKSYFPGDIYKSHSGKTVEITNADAEGRLVLADAFSYVQKHYKPAEIIDLATLTGAILVALGDTMAGLFSNDESLSRKLFDAGEKTGERLWRIPVREEHEEAMKSDLADLRNTSKLKNGYAGSITGAAFLKEFIKEIPWAHLDIAGTAYNEGEARGEVPKYGTGFGVRLLVEYLLAK